MTAFLALLLVVFEGQTAAPVAPAPPVTEDAPRLTRVVDDATAEMCMRSLVGFRNVPVRCTVGADGTLTNCEILTANRDVLRHRARFLCIAGATRVYLPDGSPAVGLTVRMNLNGTSRFDTAPRPAFPAPRGG